MITSFERLLSFRLIDQFVQTALGPAQLIGLCLAYGLLTRTSRLVRTKAGLSILGLACAVVTYRTGFPAYVLVNVAVFGFARILAWRSKGTIGAARRWRWSLAGIGVLVASYLVESVLLQQSEWESIAAVRAAMILDMWLLLKLVTFLWDFGSGRNAAPGLAEYAVWCGLPFIFFGPVLRYHAFQRQPPWSTARPSVSGEWWTSLFTSAGILVLGAAVQSITPVLEDFGRFGRIGIVFGSVPWGWYLVTAGTLALYRQAGFLSGLALPVSFDRPFFSRNISDYWARWNMSATAVFRETLFYNRWGFRAANVYVNSIVLFFAVGAWHAVNGYWLTWGLLHGVGFSCFIAWRRWRGLGARPLPRLVGWAITYVFVCSCLAAPPQVLRLVRAAGVRAAAWPTSGTHE